MGRSVARDRRLPAVAVGEAPTPQLVWRVRTLLVPAAEASAATPARSVPPLLDRRDDAAEVLLLCGDRGGCLRLHGSLLGVGTRHARGARRTLPSAGGCIRRRSPAHPGRWGSGGSGVQPPGRSRVARADPSSARRRRSARALPGRRHGPGVEQRAETVVVLAAGGAALEVGTHARDRGIGLVP